MTTATSQWVYPFGLGPLPAEAPDQELLGGKGASLAAMSRSGLPVPPGFTITPACCRAFCENQQQWPAALEEQVRAGLAKLEEATGRQFGRGRDPLLVSVRSGAAVSMPGMMDTILNCGLHPGLADEMGDTPAFWSVYLQFITMFAKTVAGISPEAFAAVAAAGAQQASRQVAQQYLNIYQQQSGRPLPTEPWALLTECINAVFRSWNTQRAIAYRQRNDVRGPWGTAVNVQAMFPSQVSGILFTQDPNALAANQMVLESSYGLGEAVVSGDVTPDRFVVRRDNLSDVRTVLGNKSRAVAAVGDTRARDALAASLTPDQVAEICRIGLRIEEHFAQPMDIEWGWADGRFALLQCRPIRGLEVARDVEIGRTEEIARLKRLAGPQRRVWVAHNLGETLRAPTPLTWDIVGRFMRGCGGFGRLYQDLGYQPSPQVCREGFLELIGARIYADPDRLAELFWGDSPMRYDLDALSKDNSLLDQAPGKFDPHKADGSFFLHLPRMVMSMFRAARITKRLRKTARDRFEQEVLPPFTAYVQQKRQQDLSRLDTPQVCAELHERCARVLDDFGKESLKPGFFGGVAFAELRRLLVQLLGPDEGGQLACTLTMGLEGDTTVAQNQLLYRVAHGEVALEQFLETYGHRAIGEMELAEPRWRENPARLRQTLEILRRSSRSPADIHRQHAAERSQVEKDLPGVLADCGGRSFREQIEALLREVQTLLPYRESGKHYLMMGYELLRLAILEIARRWDLGRDIFFLHLDELERFEQDRRQLQQAVAQRKTRWQSLQRLDMPDVIDSRDLEQLGLAQEHESVSELKGDAVAAGIATGAARIVFDPGEARDLGENYVLVCPSTDPGWTALFVGARALIVERGGVLSHGAIVARDFGIPAVVCPHATSRIPDGAQIRVDGNRGTIQVIAGA